MIKTYNAGVGVYHALILCFLFFIFFVILVCTFMSLSLTYYDCTLLITFCLHHIFNSRIACMYAIRISFLLVIYFTKHCVCVFFSLVSLFIFFVVLCFSHASPPKIAYMCCRCRVYMYIKSPSRLFCE